MKEFWIEISQKASPDEKDAILKLARESCDFILTDEKAVGKDGKHEISIIFDAERDKIQKLKDAGKKVALRIRIEGKEDEEKAVKAAANSIDYIIIDCANWRVIPLENLIAKIRNKSKLLAEVSNNEEAQLVLKALELGTDGILLKTSDSKEVSRTLEAVRKQDEEIAIVSAKIVGVKPIEIGARVCVDTCDLMEKGEGLLVGCQSAGLFLVEAEVHENPYVQPRPFRVNAGSLSMYTLGSLENTRYLSELKAGEKVVVVNRNGKVRLTNVGRVKIEFRPLILVEAIAKERRIKVILQNAETIRLVTDSGSKPVTELQIGDEVLTYLAAKGGRHFGISVPEEKVIEH